MLYLVRRMTTACTKHANSTAFPASPGHKLHNDHQNVDSFTYVSLLQCCIQKKALHEGKRIHALILNHNETAFREDILLQNTLLAMYVKCGSLVEARAVFEGMQERDVFSWNVIIGAYKKQGLPQEALALFHQMQRNKNGVHPNEFTFGSVVAACAISASLEEGVDIHRKIIRSGFHSDLVVGNALIDMYAKFGRMHKACVLFDKMKHRDTISWNAMIAGFAENYLLEAAVKYFEKMPQRNTISWNAMITGYAQNGNALEALKCFQNMQTTGLRPDSVTFASILPMCSTFAALERGMEVHGKVIRSGVPSHVILINALIDMYAKCGSIDKARLLFDKMHCRITTSWNAMIAGYAMHGCGKEAIRLFEEMEHFGISPDHVTLLGVLSACSHAGLVDEGYQYFNSMNEYYHITPVMKHYVCMVDLLGRVGRLDEAKEFVYSMPIKPDAVVWSCLLGACRTHNNLELAELVAEHLLELDTNHVPYVLLSNIYAMSGRWNELENVRKLMKDRGIHKQPGCSWIEVNKQVHSFISGDESYSTRKSNYEELNRLFW